MADHSNLPAPYESPWRQLGRAARAALASLGLDLRGLWRRNRSGELRRPAWWPRALAPLFWPLLLAGSLGLVLLGAGGLAGLRRQSQQTPAPLTTAAEVSDADDDSVERDSPVVTAEQARAITDDDPLRDQLSVDDRDNWIVAADTAPERQLVVLTLNDSFNQLEPSARRSQAERWLERSLELGFEQLELRGRDAALLGYRARVGSGMILLDPAATA